jgi:fructan beta-fructosidase
MNITKSLLLGFLLFFMLACKNNKFIKKEKYRPQIHFSPNANWMNDPNGLVYYKGEYHLFFQYYPDSTVWGPMHWGHAISKDLVKWEELPIAIYPDSLGWIFSGSCVVDWNNTTQLGTKENPPMVAIFTYHNEEIKKLGLNNFQSQGMAYSLDNGRNWIKYSKNPVLANPGIIDFRDPKVSWNEDYNKWVMIMAAGDHVNIYSSDNLMAWKLESEFGKNLGEHGGVWECPDLFKLKEMGTKNEKWVMLVSINPGAPNGGSGTQYFVGDFDGKAFRTDQKATKWLDYGKDNYAGVTFNNIAKEDGRRLFIGWMNNWQYATVIPTTVWRSACTVTRELKLIKKTNEYIVSSLPISEYNGLINNTLDIKPQIIDSVFMFDNNQVFPAVVELEIKNINAETIKIEIFNETNEKVIIGYNLKNNNFFIDNTANGWNNDKKEFAKISYGPHKLNNENLKIKLIIDKASVELFAQDGALVMTNQFFPKTDFNKIKIVSENGKAEIINGKINILNSIF